MRLPPLNADSHPTSTSSLLQHAERDYARPGLTRTLAGYAACLELARQLTDQRPLPGLGREQQSSAQRRLHHAPKIEVAGAVGHVR